MFRFPLTKRPQVSREPFSMQTLAKASRLRGATVTESICPYCAVGCGQLIFSKGGELIDIEGDPESPISGGHLCPKGANAFQLAVNSHRVRNVLYRAPHSDHWETKTLDWALDQIAQRVKATRDADFTTRDEQGRLLNSVRSIGTLGRGNDRQRGELPHQEAVRRRPGSGVDRKPGTHMTQRLGARSGRLVRPRRGHQLSAGHGK